ncbi:hypothetical protein QJS66_12675 [Kocuria rhizophila]|nr:hypothetical protein QJS66_12675 [Kocuria rhizophila]
MGWIFGVLGVMAMLPDSFAVQPVTWTGFLLILAGAVVVAVLAWRCRCGGPRSSARCRASPAGLRTRTGGAEGAQDPPGIR